MPIPEQLDIDPNYASQENYPSEENYSSKENYSSEENSRPVEAELDLHLRKYQKNDNWEEMLPQDR